MPGDDIEPPLRQLGHGGVAVECRRLDLRQLLQLHGSASDRFLTRFATDALGSGAAGSNAGSNAPQNGSNRKQPWE